MILNGGQHTLIVIGHHGHSDLHDLARIGNVGHEGLVERVVSGFELFFFSGFFRDSFRHLNLVGAFDLCFQFSDGFFSRVCFFLFKKASKEQGA